MEEGTEGEVRGMQHGKDSANDAGFEDGGMEMWVKESEQALGTGKLGETDFPLEL